MGRAVDSGISRRFEKEVGLEGVALSDVKWIKIVSDIFDDEKMLLIESLPKADSIIVIWFKLLCLAGKNNNSGVFMISDKVPYTDEMLATIFRRDVKTVRLAMKTFEEYGMVEVIDGVYTLPNWGKHQSLEKIEKRTSYMKNYMSEYRDKQKKKAECKQSCKPNCKVNNDVNSKQNETVNSVNSKPNSKHDVNCAEEDIYKEDKKEEYKQDKQEQDIEKEKDKEKRSKRKEVYFPDEKLNNAFLDYIEMRKKIRSPMTERAIKICLNKLKELADKDGHFDNDLAIAIIEQSIVNDWKSFYPIKDKQKQANGQRDLMQELYDA